MKHRGQLVVLLTCFLGALNMPALALQVIQPRLILAESHNVTLKCAYDNTRDEPLEQFRIHILKGERGANIKVCDLYFDISKNKLPNDQSCQGQPRNGSVLITFNGLNTSQSDLYICQIQKIHPPPYITSFGNGTWIFISPDRVEMKPCGQFTQTTLIILVLTAFFMLYSVLITCLHWPLGTTACILRMKEAVDMKCELIHNSDEPATATWTGQRWETGPRQGKC
ncbi:cytotoxic T-lymphocyte protein 4-like isoform X2 [Carcharodon carcharias]|uniref:cytotoxic T-lymphocyte protein 4-like isoform X2 n=1 Tax=Carcharodon carcharias TaxID=13397 RepID=UPI001B7F0821|nr:cytotoxic T-lymphocyte protein 4-like isoform X2 [Carcharodon carcharias]